MTLLPGARGASRLTDRRPTMICLACRLRVAKMLRLLRLLRVTRLFKYMEQYESTRVSYSPPHTQTCLARHTGGASRRMWRKGYRQRMAHASVGLCNDACAQARRC
jgi:hypothetical protein